MEATKKKSLWTNFIQPFFWRLLFGRTNYRFAWTYVHTQREQPLCAQLDRMAGLMEGTLIFLFIVKGRSGTWYIQLWKYSERS